MTKLYNLLRLNFLRFLLMLYKVFLSYSVRWCLSCAMIFRFFLEFFYCPSMAKFLLSLFQSLHKSSVIFLKVEAFASICVMQIFWRSEYQDFFCFHLQVFGIKNTYISFYMSEYSVLQNLDRTKTSKKLIITRNRMWSVCRPVKLHSSCRWH